MPRPYGSKNARRTGYASTSTGPAVFTTPEETKEPATPQGTPALRRLRELAIRAGARNMPFWWSAEQVEAEIRRLGEDPGAEEQFDDFTPVIFDPKNPVAEWKSEGLTFELSTNGAFTLQTSCTIGIDRLIVLLEAFRDRADLLLGGFLDLEREEHFAEESRLQQESETAQNPPPPSPDDILIDRACEQFGFTFAMDANAKVVKLCEALGIEFGVEKEDAKKPTYGSVPNQFIRYTAEELRAKVLEELKKPVTV